MGVPKGLKQFFKIKNVRVYIHYLPLDQLRCCATWGNE